MSLLNRALARARIRVQRLTIFLAPRHARFVRPRIASSLLLFPFLLALVMLALGTTPAQARDRTRPSAPGSFRASALSPFSASLTWTPASDNSGSFSYRLASTASSAIITLPQSATSYTVNTGLYPRNTYTFIFYAIDAAGNASSSVSASTTLPRDVTAPHVAPIASATSVGATHVTLSWTPAQDDGPYLFYQVLRDGSPYGSAGTSTTITLNLLTPQTPYAFSVRAYDYGPNYSAPSNTVIVTTNAANAADVTPPSTPANLTLDSWCDGEVHLRWTQSTDDFDPPSLIRYDVYVNGILSDTLVGSGGPSIVYGEPFMSNTFEVTAADSAGNASAPALLVDDLCS